MTGTLLLHRINGKLRDLEMRPFIGNQFSRVFVMLDLAMYQFHPDHACVEVYRTVNILDRKAEMPVRNKHLFSLPIIFLVKCQFISMPPSTFRACPVM